MLGGQSGYQPVPSIPTDDSSAMLEADIKRNALMLFSDFAFSSVWGGIFFRYVTRELHNVIAAQWNKELADELQLAGVIAKTAGLVLAGIACYLQTQAALKEKDYVAVGINGLGTAINILAIPGVTGIFAPLEQVGPPGFLAIITATATTMAHRAADATDWLQRHRYIRTAGYLTVAAIGLIITASTDNPWVGASGILVSTVATVAAGVDDRIRVGHNFSWSGLFSRHQRISNAAAIQLSGSNAVELGGDIAGADVREAGAAQGAVSS